MIPVERTSRGLELLLGPLPVDHRGRWLEAALRDTIRSGRLSIGSILPSSRALARDLGCSRSLVVEAYQQLSAEGYVTSRPGSATFVTGGAGEDEGVRTAHPSGAAPGAGEVRGPGSYDMRPGEPDLSTFPRSAWLASVRHVMQQAPDGLFGYGDPRGSVDLRTILSSYLARVRGVLAPREQICVSTGFAQALRLACDIFRAKGIRRVAIEDPSHPQMRNLITRAGMALMPIPVDEQGIRVDELAKSGARAVVVGPAHQYPLGVVMSPQRRAALVRWARDRDGLIVEDDYDAEFRYDRAPIGAVQGLAPEYVLHVGTVSKSLAPGLRLGWLSAPSKLVSTVMEIKSTYDIHSPVLDQLTIAHLIETGRFDRHIRKVRQQYRARRDTIVEAITAKFPDVRVRGISAGIHVLVELPSDISEDAAVSCAAAHSVRCVGLAGHYAIPGPRTPGLVLGYTSTAPHSLGPAIRALLRGLEDARCAAR